MNRSPSEAVDSNASPDSWDFLTGHGTGATASDKSAVAKQFAARSLGFALSADEAFWAHAEAIAGSRSTARTTQSRARVYVPRRSVHRAAITRLLCIAARNVEDRPLAKFRVLNAGMFAWTDGEPREGWPKYAVRPDAHLIMDLGAELVRRRGACLCLLEGCRQPLQSKRRPTFSGGPTETTARRDYCDKCYSTLPDERRTRHGEAIRTVLDRATPVILDGRLPNESVLDLRFV